MEPQPGSLQEGVREAQLHYQRLLLDTPPADLFLFFWTGACLAAGIAWNIRRLWRWLLTRREFAPGPWTLRNFMALFYLYFLGHAVFSAFAPRWDGGSMVVYWAANMLFCGVTISWVVLKKNPLGSIGLRSFCARDAAAVAGGYMLFLPCFFAAYIVAQVLFAGLGIEPRAQEVAENIVGSEGLPLWFGIATAALAAPILEEFVFRVFLYGSLRKVLGVWCGCAATSAIFALSHANALAFLPIFALGIFLNVLYERTQCVWVPAMGHALHNSVTLAYLLLIR